MKQLPPTITLTLLFFIALMTGITNFRVRGIQQRQLDNRRMQQERDALYSALVEAGIDPKVVLEEVKER